MTRDTAPAGLEQGPRPHTPEPATEALAGARIAGLSQALADIVNPIGRLARDAKAQGARLSGMAWTIANDVGFLKRIAAEALQASGVCMHHSDRPVRDILDGEPLCQSCCESWARGEGEAALESAAKGKGAGDAD